MEVEFNSESKLYNITPTPTPPPSPIPSATSSSMSSPPTSSFITHFCDKILSTLQRVWNWVKEKIFGKKEEPISIPEPVPFWPEEMYTLKNENPEKFLKLFIENMFNNMGRVLDQVRHFPDCNGDREKVIFSNFYICATDIFGRTGQLDEKETLALFQIEIEQGIVQTTTIQSYIQKINFDLHTDGLQKVKVKSAKLNYETMQFYHEKALRRNSSK